MKYKDCFNQESVDILYPQTKERKSVFSYGVALWTRVCAKSQCLFCIRRIILHGYLKREIFWCVSPLAVTFIVKTVERNKSTVATSREYERFFHSPQPHAAISFSIPCHFTLNLFRFYSYHLLHPSFEPVNFSCTLKTKTVYISCFLFVKCIINKFIQ